VLHARTRNTLHLGEIGTLLLQSLQNKVDGLEPQGDGREDFAFIGVCEDTLLNPIFGEIGVKVDFGLVNKFKVGTNDDT
jgi:hypothetical protein